MAKKGGDSAEGAKDDKNKKDSNLRLSRQISKYLRKQFYGSSDRSMISRDDHKKIRAEIDQANTILDDTRKIDSFKMLLEANEKVPTTGQLVEKAGEMLQYENAMWDQGVHPEEFKERYEKVQKNLEAADHHNRKRVTSRDTNAYLSEWKNDRTELSTLIDKFRQKPEEVQKEVAEKLPTLVKKAQETLERLNRIQDWKNKRAKLDRQTRVTFTLSRECVMRCIQEYFTYDKAEIREQNKLPRIYTELDYNIKTLSTFVDTFDGKRSKRDLQSSDRLQDDDEVVEANILHISSDVGPKSPTRRSFERLLQKVSQLDVKKYDNEQALADAIYEFFAVDTQQKGFSKPSDEANFKQSLLGISPPEGVSVDQVGGFLNFTNDNEKESDDSYRRRLLINCYPDHIVKVTNNLVQEIPKFPCISEIKVTYYPREAIERKDNIVIYFSDPPGEDNKAAVGKFVLDKCGAYTRLGHPEMTERIDSKTPGISFADQSHGSSFGHSRVNPIAAVVWKLHQEGQPITYQTILPQVEEAYRLAGIDSDDPQWDTK